MPNGSIQPNETELGVEPDRRYVVRDAYWKIRPIEYVSHEPPLRTTLFDDPQRLRENWRRAHQSLRDQANESEAERRELAARTEQLLERIARDVSTPQDTLPVAEPNEEPHRQEVPRHSPGRHPAPAQRRTPRARKPTHKRPLRTGQPNPRANPA